MLEHHEAVPITSYHECLAEEEVSAIAKILRKVSSYKGYPEWDLPSEVWKIVLNPTLSQAKNEHGIGYKHDLPDIHNEAFREAMTAVLAEMRAADWAPTDWHRSQAVTLNKQNGKIGCKSLRLVHMLSDVGKAWYKQSMCKWGPYRVELLRSWDPSLQEPRKCHRCSESMELALTTK